MNIPLQGGSACCQGSAVFIYQFVEDTWASVAAWCRQANDLTLAGGEAWLLTANSGQQQWIKTRLLRAGHSLVGLRMPDAAALRRLLCARFDVEPPAHGSDTTDFLLRLRALSDEAEGIARHPAAWRSALEDLDAADWLNAAHEKEIDARLIRDFPAAVFQRWLPELRASRAWTPAIDRELRRRALPSSQPAGAKPLSVLALGWDALCWPRLDLLLAALHAASPVAAQVFLPSPRGIGIGEALAQNWIEAVAGGLGMEAQTCPASGWETPHAGLVARLESVDWPDDPATSAKTTVPEMLVGEDWCDQLGLAKSWITQWLVETADDPSARLAVLLPRRSPTSVAILRALASAGVAAEDNLGEKTEPPLALQIARAVLDYQLDETGVEPLLTLVGLLNDHPESCVQQTHDFGLPIDSIALRRALADAFGDLQHRSARLLAGGPGFERSPLVGPLGRLIAFLDPWPETLAWSEARQRWRDCLAAFALDADALLPLWPRLTNLLPPDEPVPARLFFEYLRDLLANAAGLARPAPERRAFSRIFITTLPGAVGQTWHSLLFLDSNEGIWPRARMENPVLDDRQRDQLNACREQLTPAPGHLITAADRGRQENTAFYEILENCTGQIAFASTRQIVDGDSPGEAHPNEWSLRCWVECASEHKANGWLERWRQAARRVPRPTPALAKSDAAHLRRVFQRRRNAKEPFDEYHFDFSKLAADPNEELPFGADVAAEKIWTASQLRHAWLQPATFALRTSFGAQSWREGASALERVESAAVGRLTHRWVRAALDGAPESRPLSVARIDAALATGLAEAERAETTTMRRALSQDGELPPWWRGVFAKTAWAARQCLEALRARVEADPRAAAWFCMRRGLSAQVATAQGSLELRAWPDLLLLDQRELAGAACQVIDLRTGSSASTTALTAAQLDDGRALPQAAELFIALENGVDPARSVAGVLHPESVCWEALRAIDPVGAQLLSPDGALTKLARQQRGGCFGQAAPATEKRGGSAGENLPLATTPIDPRVLEAKAALR